MNVPILTKNSVLTMTSREIADLTGKEHKHVLRDINVMFAELGLTTEGCTQTWTHPQNGQTYIEYSLDRELTETLLTGYSAVLRRKVIARWHELEAATAPAIPNFANPAQAARAWAEQYEARLIAETTKAQIGAKREATAMNTASQAVKKANKLEIELDKSKEYATVKRVEMLYHGTTFNWRLLKSVAAEMAIPPIDVFDANYGTVKAYHAEVWQEAYAVAIYAKEAA